MAPSADLVVNSDSEEKQWVLQMESILERGSSVQVNIDKHPPVCIFRVPQSIREAKPRAYTPQVLALGPYNHFNRKLYQMQNYKIDRARKVAGVLELVDSKTLFNELIEVVKDIRESYSEHLTLSDETLSRMMAIDGLFLLNCIFLNPDEFYDSLGRSLPKGEIFRDLIMMENQIPNFVLESLLAKSNQEIYSASVTDDLVDQEMYSASLTDDLVGQEMYSASFSDALVELCSKISPIELQGDAPPDEFVGPQHVLDALHQVVWLGKKDKPQPPLCGAAFKFACALSIKQQEFKRWIEIFKAIWGQLRNLNPGFAVAETIVNKLIVPILESLGISVSSLLLEKKVLIPSATQLSHAGVKFCRVKRLGGIKDISFPTMAEIDKNKAVAINFSLPALNLKDKVSQLISDVAIRNLLAYEALVPTVRYRNFTRYVQVMSALIQGDEDVDVLKAEDVKVVPAGADSGEVVKLFSSLKESAMDVGDSDLDEKISNVNDFYIRSPKVKMRRIAKRYTCNLLKFFIVVALIVVLVALGAKLVCSFLTCPRISKTNGGNSKLSSFHSSSGNVSVAFM